VPAIRDGRGVLTVHDMGVPPPANPSGPVERIVEPSVMVRVPEVTGKSNAEYLAASRARGAKAGGFVKGATKPLRSPAERLASVTRQQEEAAASETARWLEEQKTTAAPAISDAPKRRLGVAPGYKRSPETRERMRLGQLARYERIRAGLGADGPLAPDSGGGSGRG